MALAFSITETMTGSHHFVEPSLGDGSDQSLIVRIRWGGELSAVLNPLSARFLNYDAEGSIFIEGLASEEIPCSGWLRLDYFRDHKIVYRLDFKHDGHVFHYTGEKTNVHLRRPLQLVKTHTTCYGAVTNERGQTISKSIIHFKPSSMPAFLRSLRLKLV